MPRPPNKDTLPRSTPSVKCFRLDAGGKEDYALALKQYRLAAQQGDRMAQYRMGTLREEEGGAPRNLDTCLCLVVTGGNRGVAEAVQARDGHDLVN